MINPPPDANDADANSRQTQEQRADATLARLEAALHDADIGTWFFDTVNDRVEADRNMARFFSVTEAEANGGPLASYLRPIYPDDLERVTQAISHSITTGRRYDTEFRLVRPDGEWFWIAARGKVSLDAAGRPVSMSGVVIDVTAKRMAEAGEREARTQAQRERLLLDAVLDAIPAGVIIADAQGKIVRFNTAFEQIWGGSVMAPDVAGYGEYVGYWHDSGERVQAEEWAMARALRGETCPGDIVEIETFDGRGRRIILNCAAPVRDAEGRIIAGVVAEMDITEQVRAEDALRANQTHIETLNARLLRSMRETHHRVKNNLQVIAALVEIQDEEAFSPALQRIKNHARALASIHDMLTQQVKEGDELTHISTADIMARLLPALEQVSGGRAFHSDIQDFAFDIQKAGSLALLVNECVSNAIKHSKGNVYITLACAGDTATLTIRDDGEGFAPDFDPRTAANTGLELIDSAARWDLRGDVRFANAPTGGGCVVCTFPIL